MSGHAPRKTRSRTKLIGVAALLVVVAMALPVTLAWAVVRAHNGTKSPVGASGPAATAMSAARIAPLTTSTAAATSHEPTPTATPKPTKTAPRHTSSATGGSGAASAPVTVGQACTATTWRTSSPDAMWSTGNYVVHNNMWNASSYKVSQSIAACSYHSWNVTVTANNSAGDGAVKTYPNVHRDYHNWDTNKEPAWSSFKQLRSTFATAAPRVGIYDVAYDIWMNGVPGNREIMIWTDNYNQQPSGSKVSSISVSGITWDVWATSGNDYLAFVPRSRLTSGSLDLKAMIDYLVSKGRVPRTSTLGQVCFGVEIVSTGGKAATFKVTNFSITSS
jgi:hypothetical protein